MRRQAAVDLEHTARAQAAWESGQAAWRQAHAAQPNLTGDAERCRADLEATAVDPTADVLKAIGLTPVKEFKKLLNAAIVAEATGMPVSAQAAPHGELSTVNTMSWGLHDAVYIARVYGNSGLLKTVPQDVGGVVKWLNRLVQSVHPDKNHGLNNVHANRAIAAWLAFKAYLRVA